jgi:hypothetical protein
MRGLIKLVTNTSEPGAKIALFRLLFQGREDVCPVRFHKGTLRKAEVETLLRTFAEIRGNGIVGESCSALHNRAMD